MSKGKSLSNDNRGFRKKTEQYLSGKPKKEPPRESASLTHELQVHQIEFQMQNEELLRAQHEAEESQARYLTFDEKGLISQLNLTAAALLGIERAFLINKPFSSFLKPEFQDAFYLHRQEVLQSHARKTCELVLKRKDGTLFDGQLESAAAEVNGGRVILTMLTDTGYPVSCCNDCCLMGIRLFSCR